MAAKRFQGLSVIWRLDINRLPQAILVTRANVSDRSGALAMFSLASQNLELVQHVMVDGGYTGNDFADQVKLILNAKTMVRNATSCIRSGATATMDR